MVLNSKPWLNAGSNNYEGFELIANASRDVANPKRSLPIAYIGGVLMVIAMAYGANIRTGRMILLSTKITDNLFCNDERHNSLPVSGHRFRRLT